MNRQERIARRREVGVLTAAQERIARREKAVLQIAGAFGIECLTDEDIAKAAVILRTYVRECIREYVEAHNGLSLHEEGRELR